MRAAFALTLLVGVSAGAQAAVLYQNTNIAPVAADSVAFVGPLYNSFTTDSTGQVNMVSLILDNQGDVNRRGLVEIDLYDNSGNSPNNLIAVLGDAFDSQLTGSPTNFALTALALSLSPDTRYWIGLSDASTMGMSNIEWSIAGASTGFGVAGEFNASTLNGLFPNNLNPPYEMCVSSGGSVDQSCPLGRQAPPPAPTPEPATLALLGIGLTGLGLLRRRRGA